MLIVNVSDFQKKRQPIKTAFYYSISVFLLYFKKKLNFFDKNFVFYKKIANFVSTKRKKEILI